MQVLSRMVSPQVDKVVNTYKSIAQSPVLTAARIFEIANDGICVKSTWTERNLERQMKQKFLQNRLLNSAFRPTAKSFPIDVTPELLSVTTDDQERRAVLRQATVDNSTKQFIEIWDERRLVKNYDLSGLDAHGDVYVDSEFSSFEWSPDGTKLLYIAEKKLAKSEPFYKQKSAATGNKDERKKVDEETTVGTEYLYKPDWGEQLVGKHHPVIVSLDVATDKISVLENVPDDESPGQVLWSPDGNGIVGVAWKHEPRHLGLMFCTNRCSWIFLLRDEKYQKLSSDGCAVHSPRFTPDGKYLVWMEREAGGPHHNAHRLMRLRFRQRDDVVEDNEKKVDIVIDKVISGKTVNNERPFYGLYGRLPKRCWSSDSRYLFLSTPQRNNIRSYIIDTKAKDITEIMHDSGSLIILDVKNDVIAFHDTSLVKPSSLSVGRFTEKAAIDGNIERTDVISPVDIPGLENLMYEKMEHRYDSNEEAADFNFIYFGVKSGKDKSVPLIVTPHGGPHSSFANTFALDHTLFALSGFAVLQVNYRGSIGMGSANVEYLQGRVGSADVEDCVIATNEALAKYPWLDPTNVGLCGGSHGGFLVAHLSGQYNELYKAVVTRNPVIDIAAMFTISDIPDCRNSLTRNEKITYHHDVCAAETNQPYVESLSSAVTESAYAEICGKMLKASPILHVDKVKAPTLVCIGTNDLRVPPSQGKLWYQRLKANHVKTKMLVYKDNHQLGSGNAEIDSDINACLWFIEYCSNFSNPQDS